MPPSTTDDKLDAILTHLENLDRRDRLRTWGGFVRSLIGIIPILLFLYAAWYFAQHSAEILQKVAEEAAKQAASATSRMAIPSSLNTDQIRGLLQK